MEKISDPLYFSGDYEREERNAADQPRQLLSEEVYRTPFRRDYGRLIHSTAFRRLKGKQQLFPYNESDYFRNRLTHSLEVAQVAKSIAIKINHEYPEFQQAPIDLDLMELSGLAHDLGHPPFGHEGEKALDACMLHWGGFEGNAQTLRILARLEKKVRTNIKGPLVEDNIDNRRGLALTFRSLASTLKYDKKIFQRDEGDPVTKGYYESEETLVAQLKQNVADGIWNQGEHGEFKTIECQIMDLADDIAYSTYDLDDGLKAGMFGIFDILARENDFWSEIAESVSRKLGETISTTEAYDVMLGILDSQKIFDSFTSAGELDTKNIGEIAARIGPMQRAANDIASNAYYRNTLTSHLVGEFIRAVRVEPRHGALPFSKISVEPEVLIKVEVLKQLAYTFLIHSPRWKLVASRSRQIVTCIFETLDSNSGHQLMPDDFRELYESYTGDKAAKKRVICDYVACMTDHYAVDFYNRLQSGQEPAFFKPH
ncbi:MAG: dNTP triphosphohydrolase [Pseudomonadales bacterium]